MSLLMDQCGSPCNIHIFMNLNHAARTINSLPSITDSRPTLMRAHSFDHAGDGIESTSLRFQSHVSIVCLTRVWQSLYRLFCDKTFEFAIQTWQTSLEHYYVYVQTYVLSQLRKILILLISSHCKMCTLPTLRSRVFVCCERYKHPRS